MRFHCSQQKLNAVAALFHSFRRCQIPGQRSIPVVADDRNPGNSRCRDRTGIHRHRDRHLPLRSLTEYLASTRHSVKDVQPLIVGSTAPEGNLVKAAKTALTQSVSVVQRTHVDTWRYRCLLFAGFDHAVFPGAVEVVVNETRINPSSSVCASPEKRPGLPFPPGSNVPW